MRLEAQLRQIRSLCDLPALVAGLGFEPLWEPLPVEAWLPGSAGMPGIREAALVGQHAGFRWAALRARDPRLARRITLWLQRRGESAGLLLYHDDGRLTVSVSFGDRPLVVLDLQQPEPASLLALRRMQDTCIGAANPLALAALIAGCLDCSDLTRAFFRDFRAALDTMAGALTGRVAAGTRLPLALLQLTRVLFLYFVQARGWLDGRRQFLAQELDHCLSRGGHVHRQFLAPLFFGTLNCPSHQRSAGIRRFGRIPFLNGGLFEPHPLERRWRGSIPNTCWRETFDRLFERYHFTADESQREGRIAPDMLGRVFEGLMAPDERHASGTFYTPPALVDGIVHRALQALVERRLGVSSAVAERMLADADPALLPIWPGLAVLDPAVGSGAFLLGAMERLDHLRRSEIPGRPARRRRILEQNLFGVDLNPTAVRLAELRLWLAVIAEEPEDDPTTIAPLPNLDCLIRQGDSLTDPFALAGRLPGSARAAALEVARLRHAVVVTPGSGKAASARALRQAEAAAARACLGMAEHELAREISEILAVARGPDLFGTRRGLNHDERQHLHLLRAQRRGLSAARRRLDRDGEVPWFHYQSHFPDVFARRGGFDLVIGNPPWVRSEHLKPATRDYLMRRYRWWRAGPGTAGYRHLPDLAVAFLERAVELAGPEGVVGVLLPAKLATAGYGNRARAALVRETTIHTVADLSADATGFEASVYPMAVITAKGPPEKPAQVCTSLRGTSPSVPLHRLSAGPWILLPSLHAMVHRLRDRYGTLAGSYSVHLGVKTGANSVFLDPPASIESELFRWAVRGRDVRPCRVSPRRRLLWTHGPDGEPLERLPPRAAAWLEERFHLLGRRADYRRAPPWRLFRTGPATASCRVVWADLARQLMAAPLLAPAAGDLIPLNTCYVVVLPDDRAALGLAAWLNCTWIRALARLTADRARGAYARFNARAVGGVPLPAAVLAEGRLERLARDAAPETLDQKTLDDEAAEYLELSAGERRALARVDDARTRRSR